MKKIVIALSFIAFTNTLYSQSFNIFANVDDELCINYSDGSIILNIIITSQHRRRCIASPISNAITII